jgi:hypothetical protein
MREPDRPLMAEHNVMQRRILSRLIIVPDNFCREIQNTFHDKYISFSENIPFYVTIMIDNERSRQTIDDRT